MWNNGKKKKSYPKVSGNGWVKRVFYAQLFPRNNGYRFKVVADIY